MNSIQTSGATRVEINCPVCREWLASLFHAKFTANTDRACHADGVTCAHPEAFVSGFSRLGRNAIFSLLQPPPPSRPPPPSYRSFICGVLTMHRALVASRMWMYRSIAFASVALPFSLLSGTLLFLERLIERTRNSHMPEAVNRGEFMCLTQSQNLW